MLAFRRGRDGDLGLALVRDGNGTRSVEALMRYRSAALAEFLRTLRTLQTLQAEARAGTDLPAAPMRKRRLLRRNEPTKAHQINGLADNHGTGRQPDARAPDLPNTALAPPPSHAPTMKQSGTPAQPSLPGRRVQHIRTPLTATDPTPARRRFLHRSPERNKPEKTRQSKSLVFGQSV